MVSSPVPPRATLPAGESSILVVEDEFLVRLIISDELRAAGYNVIEAVDAEEGIAILKSGARVDLILSDVRMPGPLDGLGLLAFVKESYPIIPVIITSGHLLAEEALADGATRFLPKPYTLPNALKLIEGELEKGQ
jgi:CheY-like chemotaxis protein